VSLLATPADFEPANENEGANALYYRPHDGSGYDHQAEYFNARIAWLKSFAPPTNQKIAVWGCGWGTLVKLAVEAGYDAFGFDAADYAVTKGKGVHAPHAGRLFKRDALLSGDTTGSKRDAGLKGQAKFAVVVTEDLLTCMGDNEILTTLPLLRSIATTCAHMITPEDPWASENGLNDFRINWKPPADWKAMLAPDVVFDAVARSVI